MGTLPVGWEEAMFWQYAGFSENGGEANVFFGSSKDLVTFAIGADE
jgi:branched-subunit amino acid aminotransferase/4-amino-4-deoxychorismate lyase